jgi:ppGpp synthetase/RelA/SpoT-type nucleotidyltranferase
MLDALRETLASRTEEALTGLKHIDRIAFRVKDRESFLEKAQKPKYTSPLVELEDQVAGRVITFFRSDIPLVKERLTNWFGPVEHETKEPASASEFDYESDHYVFVIPEHCKPEGWGNLEQMPTTFEFQVRTLFMHAWAEPQHDLGYKPGGIELDRDTKRGLAWIAASAWGADHALNDIALQLTKGRASQAQDESQDAQ